MGLFVGFMAGLLQGMVGFGAGIILMIYLPTIYTVTGSAAITGAISIVLSGFMTFQYRHFIQMEKVLKSTILYMLICTLTIMISSYINAFYLKKALAIFLVILASYYLFLSKEKQEMTKGFAWFCIILSAICDGFFGIGGPLTVIYFMAKTKDQKEYLGCIQMFFLINCIYNTGLRIYRGLLVMDYLPIILLGAGGILLGGFIAKKLLRFIDENKIRKLVYFVIGISGILNIIM